MGGTPIQATLSQADAIGRYAGYLKEVDAGFTLEESNRQAIDLMLEIRDAYEDHVTPMVILKLGREAGAPSFEMAGGMHADGDLPIVLPGGMNGRSVVFRGTAIVVRAVERVASVL